MDGVRVKALANWIFERHNIYLRRQAGAPKPWSDDPIFQNYRFCNVYRELDTVTQWIATNWRQPNTNDPHVWFAMAVSRLVNWPPTLAKIEYPVPWNPKQFVDVIESLVQDHQKAFTGVYMIPADSTYKSKAQYLAEKVLTPMWDNRGYAYQHTAGLEHFYRWLLKFNGIGTFMAGQIIADTKYTRLLDTSLDFWHFACPGPGSRRGLNRVLSQPVDKPWKESDWRLELAFLKTRIGGYIAEFQMPPLHAQDLQNCLCEFDKYERVRLGEGKPRTKFSGR